MNKKIGKRAVFQETWSENFLSLDIGTPTARKPFEPNGPVMIHDSRLIAQMIDRALPHTSNHAATEAELAYPPQRTTRTGNRSVEKKI